MKIILFIPSIETGGVERNAVYLANYLAAAGRDVAVAYTRSVKGMTDRFDDRVELIRIGKRLKLPGVHRRLIDAMQMLPGFVRMVNAQRKKSPLVVVSFQSNIVAVIGARLLSVPIAVRVSNHPSHVKHERGALRRLSELLKPWFYRYADAVITNSEVTSEHFRNRVPSPVVTIYNPVDRRELVRRGQQECRHLWLAKKETPLIVSAGRLVEQKNFGLLIKAVHLLRERVPVRLIIIGEGRERDRLETLIAGLGLNDVVELAGYMADVLPLVARADLFVLTSNYEGSPNALLEAIAVGTPAVATDCLSGPGEVLDHGKAGELVPIGDVPALAEAMFRSLSDRDSCRSKVVHAQWHLRKFYGQRVMARYESLLDSLGKAGSHP